MAKFGGVGRTRGAKMLTFLHTPPSMPPIPETAASSGPGLRGLPVKWRREGLIEFEGGAYWVPPSLKPAKETPSTWGLLPNLPGQGERRPDCTSSWREPCLSPERCRQSRCPTGQCGIRGGVGTPSPTTHVPSDTPAGPTPTHRRRRTQLHAKTQCGEADPTGAAKPWERGGKRTKTGRGRGEGRAGVL